MDPITCSTVPVIGNWFYPKLVRRILGRRTRLIPRRPLSPESGPISTILTFDQISQTLAMDSLNGATTTESHTVVRNLRLELKEWEQSFAAAHQGRKAGREDIKQHPDIGQSTSTFATCRLLIQLSTQVQAV